MYTLAKALAQTLVDFGTEFFFCVTGGDQDLWLALDEVGIRIVNCRTEQAAVYAADGYARVSGKPGIVYGQRGPGVANVAAALADPHWAGSPVVSLTSATSTRNRARFDYQDINQLPLHDPVTKWSQGLLRPDDGARLLRAAIRSAAAVPTGPAHLEIPMDFFGVEVPAESPDPTATAALQVHRPIPADNEVSAVLAQLAASARPLVIAGAGVIRSEAFDELSALAELLQLPVATTLGGKGAISESHPLAIGVIGRYSRKSANKIAEEADCVLVLGSRLGGMATNANRVPSPDATVLHVDVDPAVLRVNYTERESILADAKLFLTALREQAVQDAMKPTWTSWVQQCQDRTAQWTRDLAVVIDRSKSGPIHPASVMTALRAHAQPSDIVVSDTGFAGAWTGALYPVTATGRVYTRAVGSLGWAVAAGVGAAIGAGTNRAIVVTGDGGAAYNLMELETAARHGVRPIVIVLNNLSLGFEYHEQRIMHDNQVIPTANDFLDVDFAAIARALGGDGWCVTELDELDGVLAQAFASPRPALVDVRIDKEVYAPVTNFEKVEERIL